MSRRVNPRKLQRHLRVLCLLLAGCGVYYLLWRFENFSLGSMECSPLARFDPRDTLLLDSHPPAFWQGDAVLVTGGDGFLYLGIVTRMRPAGTQGAGVQELWMETDAADCPGQDSDEFGWIPVERVAARVLFAWPW